MTPEHRRASFWHGEAASAAGLRGYVHPKRFESVLSGHVPGVDVRLGRKRDGEHVHRPGWDITLSAPKSVSLEALVRGDRRVIRAHDQAVYETLDWIEKELLETRGWDPETQKRPRIAAHGMAVAGFRHLTSRDLDPQLHTHCILANMTRIGSGAWRSVEPTLIRRNAKLIGAYYRNELASRLVGLGFAVAPRLIGRVPGFELAGYGQDFLDAFSGRRREILRFLDERNLPYTAATTQMAALHTRRRKTEAGLAELAPAWRERAVSLGLQCEPAALRPPRPIDPQTGRKFPMPRLVTVEHPANEIRRRKRAPALPKIPTPDKPSRSKAAIRHRPGHAPLRLLKTPERSLVDVVSRAIAHMEERRTVIPRGEIRAVALGHAPGRYRLGEIEDLPADMRGFVDTVLEEHAVHQRRDDNIRGLAESLGSHWRQWPELCWKASSLGVAPEALDQHRQWRGEGYRLMAQARDLLVDRGEDGRHLSAMEGVRLGLESSLARIETVRTAADQETIREWVDVDAGWKEARTEVEKFVELVGRIDVERKEHEAGCVEAGRLLPAPSLLRSGAKRVYRMAEHLESRMDAGERNAHIRAAGKDPDSLDSTVRKIHDWLAVQERKQRKSLSLDHDGISM